MADDGLVIRGIDWNATFPFTRLFRSFRVAIHLSKLVLGLGLLLGVYFGGKVLDAFWPVDSRTVTDAYTDEVSQYQKMAGKSGADFRNWRESQRDAVQARYADLLRQYNQVASSNPLDPSADPAMDMARKHQGLSKLVDAIKSDLDKQISDGTTAYQSAIAAAKSDADKSALTKQYNDGLKILYTQAEAQIETAERIKGDGLFDTFFQYETHQVNGAVVGVSHNRWLSEGRDEGVVRCIINFVAVGPTWLAHIHTIFFILFAIWFLFCWSLFGGAISRIAAVHVARDEKISVRQAMNFAVGKMLSFVSSPLIPILIVVVIGTVIMLLSAAVGWIPQLGPIVIGVLFVVALLAGFVMTLVLLGTVGGLGLMYPTIAVEGSDSFDAISRSFSYVYSKPWRFLFYTGVAIAYGAITYLFVHLFIWVMLVLTHFFVGIGIFAHAKDMTYMLDAMWPSPQSVSRLSYHPNYLALNTGQCIGAFFIRCWVMLLVSFLGAFAISLYFSSNTIIYFLLRRDVDATELDDVYLEQADEDLEAPETPPTPAETPAATPVAATAEADVPPAAPPAEPPPANPPA